MGDAPALKVKAGLECQKRVLRECCRVGKGGITTILRGLTVVRLISHLYTVLTISNVRL